MDNIIMKNMKPKALAMILLSMGSAGVLLGCSQADGNVETVASKQEAAQTVDYQASRNNGAWGGVLMSRDELAEPPTNIVDAGSLPTMAEDASLAKWQAKFEGAEVKTRQENANSQTAFEYTNGFITNDGEKLYHDSCAGCHMHDGKGAIGAGYYPPLANNSKMQSKYYVIDILINGLRGMPSFHNMMNDEQMAAVTQYVHSELNNFTDTVTVDDVAQLRHDNPPGADPSE